MRDITKKYSNGEVTIVWKPNVCIHSCICWRNPGGLPEVFDPSVKPWIKPEGASTEKIINQVEKCPSGALTYFMNESNDASTEIKTDNVIEVTENGPLMVYGNITIKHKDGSTTQKNKVTAFCRCGSSGNKPYCDGTHKKINFSG